jgi:hypothetical protein
MPMRVKKLAAWLWARSNDDDDCQILCRSLELLVWCFQTQSTSFFGFFFGVMAQEKPGRETDRSTSVQWVQEAFAFKDLSAIS